VEKAEKINREHDRRTAEVTLLVFSALAIVNVSSLKSTSCGTKHARSMSRVAERGNVANHRTFFPQATKNYM
jgi:hypothetical protein